MADLYTWRVVYRDGTYLDEFERTENGQIDHGFGEVAQDRAAHVVLFPNVAPNVEPNVEPSAKNMTPRLVSVPEGARPIFFRRRQISQSGQSATIHCVGWQRTERELHGQFTSPVNRQVLLFVFEDGSSLLTDDYQAV